jgi:hypothetical protein
MRRIHALVAVLLIAVAAPAMAQTDVAPAPVRPQGWWGSFGAGISGLRFSCKDCDENMPVYEAPSVIFSVGKSIGTKVAFGVDYAGAFPSGENGGRAVASSLAGLARWYPSASPFFLRFAVGISRARAIVTANGQTQSSIRNGAGISFGAGYDFRLGKSVALTPAASWYMNAIGDIGVGDLHRENVSWNTWTFGVGLTIY